MKTFTLATRVDHATKKQFVDQASSLGMTLCEYLAYYLEDTLDNQQKIQLLQEEKKALEEQNMQLQQSLADAHQAQAAKSKAQRQIEQIMQQNDAILERNFLQNLIILKKEELKQQGFHFNYTTCCSRNESSDLVHCLYNYGFSIKQDQVFIYRMNTR